MNKLKCSTIYFSAVAIVSQLAFVYSAIAADLEPGPANELYAPASDQWKFRFTPYAWATGVNGDATASGQTVDVNASFFDLVEESDSLVALMGHFEARKRELALYTDFVWSSLSFSGNRSATGPLGGLNISVDTSLDYEQTIFEAGVAYEVARFPGDTVSFKDAPALTTSYTAIDLVAGARYWRESVDLSFNITGAITLPSGFELRGNRVVDQSGTIDWVDPVVGLRARHQFSPGQELRLRGDVGGFGVGSDFSWQLFAGYGFALCDSCYGVIGYRALYVDYSEEGPNGTRGIDLLQHGPAFGVSFRW